MTGRRLDNYTRLVLAFDAGCQRCRTTAYSVAGATKGQLEILPLTHPDVERWRQKTLGVAAPWAPTLIKIEEDEDVRAWTGRSMSLPLLRYLGLRSTWHVVGAIGELAKPTRLASAVDSQSIGRKRFLQVGAGAALAAGLVVTGQLPASAKGNAKARAWVEANRNRLPVKYDDVVAYSMEYRKEIFRALPVETRAALWVEQLERYRGINSALSSPQTQVIESSLELLRFDAEVLYNLNEAEEESANRVEGRKKQIRESAIEAFGFKEARSLIATLGPNDVPPGTGADALVDECECNNPDSWCGWGWACWTPPDVKACIVNCCCGEFYCCDCNGRCVDV